MLCHKNEQKDSNTLGAARGYHTKAAKTEQKAAMYLPFHTLNGKVRRIRSCPIGG